MDGILAWIQGNLWQAGFVTLLFVCVLIPFVLVRRRINAIMRQVEHWRELEKNIQEIGKEEARYYPHPTRHVLQMVFSSLASGENPEMIYRRYRSVNLVLKIDVAAIMQESATNPTK
jgi:hypothetical protein